MKKNYLICDCGNPEYGMGEGGECRHCGYEITDESYKETKNGFGKCKIHGVWETSGKDTECTVCIYNSRTI